MSLASEGLSPRERGNRRGGDGVHHRRGSIPARAGEPRLASPLQAWRTVYPRASGGTIFSPRQ